MLLTALVVLCCSTITADTSLDPEIRRAPEVRLAAPSEPGRDLLQPSLPDMPSPKASSPAIAEEFALHGSETNAASIEPAVKSPVRPATPESYETPRQRKIWYGLMAAGHGAAAFDAWTTRRAISGGYGVEGDPLQRPFAHSGAIYASTQLCPLLMDYLGHRMMRSNHPWMRNIWWVPQAAGASVSFGAGMHNYRLVP